MTKEQVIEIYKIIKEIYLTKNYTNENIIIKTLNVAFQISNLEDQNNQDNLNISSVNLGICESILKNKYQIAEEHSLIIIKTDIKNDDLTSVYVQYEIFNPNNLTQLNLNFCKNLTIEINVPVNLSQETVLLYNSLNESGYNLFDSEDEFYNDICSTYTSIKGTDMTLSDRNTEIYSLIDNISMCQTSCEFETYNQNTRKAKCNCETQTNNTETDITKINFTGSFIAKSFMNALKYSNFLVLKCYELALSLKNIFKNIGRIIMANIYFFFLLCLFVFIIYDRKK